MSYRIQLFIAGDELSRKMLRMLDQITKLLAERFGPRMKSYSKDFIAYVLTTSIISLDLRYGVSNTIQLDVYFVLEIYQEELKARFRLTNFPAAILNGQIYTGEKALEIVSKLHSLLEISRGISEDELLARLEKLGVQESAAGSKTVTERSLRFALSILQKGVEPAIRVASRVTSGIVRMAQQPALTSSGEMEIGVVAADTQSKPEPTPKGPPMEKILFERNVIRAGISECLAKLERLREEGKIDEDTYEKMKAVYNAFLS